jgi:SAM-dependent methyltransferase
MDFTSRLCLDAGIRAGMRVLDVGCGSGDVTFLLADLLGAEGSVVGIDRDTAALAVASGRTLHARGAKIDFVLSNLTTLPGSLGDFDAIVGRRVLMYQADSIAAVRALAANLRPGGVMVFQEHDTTMVPASLDSFPLHRQATQWIQTMIQREGADLHIGFNLYRIFTHAGLVGVNVRAECLVQTPEHASGLGHIVRTCLPRIVERGVATAEEIEIETLQQRLDAERAGSSGIYIGDVAFGAWARKL